MTDESSPALYRPFPTFEQWIAAGDPPLGAARYAERFRTLRSRLGTKSEQLVERATRWAAIDTGAIEGLYQVERGFTMSVATSAAMLDAIAAEKGRDVERSVADALSTYSAVLDLATKREPVTEAAIRQLHAIVCASQATFDVYTAVGPQQQDLPKGSYKQHENRPTNVATGLVHAYASVIDTPAEMRRLIEELATPAFASANAVLQAAYAHYAFVCVHPFADGNGRVSRALASIFLYRDPGLPLVVFADQRPQYLDALEAADGGDHLRFTTFIAERLIDTVGLLEDIARSESVPTIESQRQRFTESLNGRGGLPHLDVDSASVLVSETFLSELQQQISAAQLPGSLAATVNRFDSAPLQVPDGLRVPSPSIGVQLVVQSGAPAPVQRRWFYATAITRGLDGDVDFHVLRDGVSIAEVFLRDVVPAVTTSLRFRLRAIADEQIRLAIDDVGTATEAALRQAGYSG